MRSCWDVEKIGETKESEAYNNIVNNLEGGRPKECTSSNASRKEGEDRKNRKGKEGELENHCGWRLSPPIERAKKVWGEKDKRRKTTRRQLGKRENGRTVRE